MGKNHLNRGTTINLTIDGEMALKKIKLDPGTAGAPSGTFLLDDDTGFLNPSANTFAITTGGTQRVAIDTTSVSSTLPVYGPNGAAATPTYTFTSDPDTGVMLDSANVLGFTAGGVEAMAVTATSVNPLQQVQALDGALATPAYSFLLDSNTGTYRVGNDSMGLVAGGTNSLTINSTNATSNNLLLVADGVVGAPGLAFSGDLDTGWWRASSNNICLSAGGVETFRSSSTRLVPNVQIQATAGSAGTPAYSQNGDSNTGMFFGAADTLDFSAGGATQLEVSNVAAAGINYPGVSVLTGLNYHQTLVTTTPYALLASDLLLDCGGAASVVTLPATASNLGRRLCITNGAIAAGITVTANGAETFTNGATTIVVPIGQSINLITTGRGIWFTTRSDTV